MHRKPLHLGGLNTLVEGNPEGVFCGGRRPNLTLRVGVTGHRKIEHRAAVADSVNKLLVRIHNICVALAVVENGFSAALACRVISALASGADQIVAAAGIQTGYTLHCVLPFDQDEYAKTPEANDCVEFHRLMEMAEAVVILDGYVEPRDARHRAYANAGRIVLEQSDILIAIWDGRPPDGNGGTPDIVDLAKKNGMPVLLVGVDEQASVSLFAMGKVGGIEQLESILADQLVFESKEIVHSSESHSTESARERFEDFLRETEPGIRSLRILSQPWQRIWKCMQPKNFPAGIKKIPLAKSASIASQLADRFESTRRFVSALARFYAGLYRSTFLLIALMGVAAVGLALSGLAAEWPVGKPVGHYITMALTATELGVILGMLILFLVMTTGRWRERLIDYRLLGEKFRVANYLGLLCLTRPSRESRIGPYDFDAGQHGWVDWFFQATAREAGLPRVAGDGESVLKFDSNYLDECRNEICERWFRTQQRYHWFSAAAGRRFHGILEKTALVCLLGTLAACVAHFFVEGYALGLICAFLPACSAACHAIISQAELHRNTERSESMEKRFEQLRNQLATINIAVLHSGRLSEIATEAAILELDDVADWRLIFHTHPPHAPG